MSELLLLRKTFLIHIVAGRKVKVKDQFRVHSSLRVTVPRTSGFNKVFFLGGNVSKIMQYLDIYIYRFMQIVCLFHSKIFFPDCALTSSPLVCSLSCSTVLDKW